MTHAPGGVLRGGATHAARHPGPPVDVGAIDTTLRASDVKRAKPIRVCHDRRMGRAALLFVVALCAPRAALACGACVDAAFRAQSWWAPALGPSLCVLVVDAVVFAAASRVAGFVPRVRMRRFVLIGFVASFAAAMWQGGSGVWGIGAFVVVLACGFVASLTIEAARRAVWSVARLTGVVAGVVVLGLAPARPATRKTTELVRVAAPPHATWAPVEGWAIDELLQRDDVQAAFDEQLARTPPTSDPASAWRAHRSLLRLHARVSGAPAWRMSTCAKAGVVPAKIVDAAERGEAARLCGA